MAREVEKSKKPAKSPPNHDQNHHEKHRRNRNSGKEVSALDGRNPLLNSNYFSTRKIVTTKLTTRINPESIDKGLGSNAPYDTSSLVYVIRNMFLTINYFPRH
ncbi:hypothetical protein TIFTF001_017177 [Ficus carica]|uniref:Uncharacterized protein n=1 Tax=Ficus carica TaxID=3494 RepID=A0AA88DAH1_FICCA|nr:hypothetical protein TIFTF001_017177 [Ficus carica]